MLLLALLACSSPPPQTITVYVDSDDPALAAITTMVERVGDDRLTVSVESASIAQAEQDEDLAIVVEPSGECGECYILRDEDGAWQVEGGGLLGKQYGLAHMLELFGYRFPHPFQARVPAVLPKGLDDDHPDLLRVHAPEQTLRGLHLHTLHPIEGLFGFWDEVPGGAEGAELERVEAVVDWVVKNRGNHLQWVGLDDIEDGGAPHEAWLARATAANEAAHARGLTTGLGVQLFGSGNLQQAFDLLDSDPGDREGRLEAMAARWALVTPAGFDVYDLSFGEFFGEDPQSFVDAATLARQSLAAADPEAEMSAVVHVGASEDQRVEYDGQSMIYYMLAQYVEDTILHVHTVMYYNLYDDAGGAYHHDDFSEHRALIQQQLQQGERVAYFPESAYWVAFDNPVPLYLPLYVKSRHHDIASLRADALAAGAPDLDEHVLFSTGWEWGYWQNDAFTLRMGYELPPDWGDLYRDWFAVDGADGLALAQAVVDLAEAQHVALIEGRGAAYLAGRDAAMDVGFGAGIVAAPDRLGFEELAALGEAERAAFDAATLEPLRGLEAATAQALDAVQALDLVRTDRWAQEIRDGVEVDLYRVRFTLGLYQAVLAGAAGEDPTPSLAAADEAWAQARAVVDRRHADLHDPLGETLVDDGVENPTIYDYGYLLRAGELCFWERERVQAARLLEGSDEQVPSCF
ncbi:hypothetical protein L6R53_07395 [Myxococcota bacterium]|nr:hypothetical protein [Myxococcota bacterium]